MSKWRKCNIKLWNCVIYTIQPKNPTQNPFHNGESLPKWHLNGKWAENEENVEGGKNVKIVNELYYLYNSTPKIPLKIHFTMVRFLPAWHINGKLAENDKNVENGESAK